MKINDLLFFVLQPTNGTEQALYDKERWKYIWYGVLSNILTGIFDYENVNNVLRRRIDQSFFNSAYVCAFKDSTDNQIVAPANPTGRLNAWNEYSAFMAIMPDGTEKQVTKENAVIGYNYNITSVSDSVLAWQYAQCLAELKVSIDNAIILSRKSALLEVPDKNSLNEVLTQFNNHTVGNPVTVSLNRPDTNFKTLSFSTPETISSYYDGLRDVLNEFLTVTGLSSLVNPNKKERLITSEISSNDDIKNTLLSNRIQNRKEFIANVNEKFGTDWKVDVDDKIIDTVNGIFDYEKGAKTNVQE